jgi:hypothetical protein
MIPRTVRAALNRRYRPGQSTLEESDPVLARSGRHLLPLDAWTLWTALSDEPNCARYLAFMRECLARFNGVRDWFKRNVKPAEGEHIDAIATGGWAGPALLPMASILYSAHEDGLHGAFVECGVFRGGTTACISHVAERLGFRYFAADTFEGLPSGSANGFYMPGQFRGGIDEVRCNVEAVGAPSSVTYLPGLFSDTLHQIQEPILAAFLDTDLYVSSMSALNGLKNQFTRQPIIFSDGVGQPHFESGMFVRDGVPAAEEARAIVDFWGDREFTGHFCGYGNMSVFAPSERGMRMIFDSAFAKALVAMLIAENRKWPAYVTYQAGDPDALIKYLSDMILEASYYTPTL